MGIPMISYDSINMLTPTQTIETTSQFNTANSQEHYDVIVIGVGSMGASTCCYLAQQGLKVLGLEQFSIPHQMGSHSGQSRIIRKAYFEHPDYVPLLLKAYENWHSLEKATDTQLYYPTGFVYFGPPEHSLLTGVKESAKLYDLPLDHISPDIAAKQFPQFHVPDDYECILEPQAGFITPERAILTYAEEAIKMGCDIVTNAKVNSWERSKKGVKVNCEDGTYSGKKLVITSGAWSSSLIPGLSSKLQVTRQVLAWLKPKRWEDFSLDNFKCWTIAEREKPGIYYGFPILPSHSFFGPIGLKVAYHYPGQQINPDSAASFDPSDEINDLKKVLDKYLPQAFDSVLEIKSCLYTNTPDEHFIIDLLPGYEDIVSVACGFSGHGFKFVSVVGEALTDLAIKGQTDLPIEFLNAKRFI